MEKRNIEPSTNPTYVVCSKLKLVKDYAIAVIGGIATVFVFTLATGSLTWIIADVFGFLLIRFAAICVVSILIDEIGKWGSREIRKIIKTEQKDNTKQ